MNPNHDANRQSSIATYINNVIIPAVALIGYELLDQETQQQLRSSWFADEVRVMHKPGAAPGQPPGPPSQLP